MPSSKNLIKIEERILEALQHRGYSSAESRQMVDRLKIGIDFDEVAETRIPFGKYAGMTIAEVAEERLSYLTWLTAQGWFIEKFREIYNRVTIYLRENYGSEISDIIKEQKERYDAEQRRKAERDKNWNPGDDIPF